MAKAKATKNSADIGFEKQLWDAADVLRGNMDAADYKNVVLGLILLYRGKCLLCSRGGSLGSNS